MTPEEKIEIIGNILGYFAGIAETNSKIKGAIIEELENLKYRKLCNITDKNLYNEINNIIYFLYMI